MKKCIRIKGDTLRTENIVLVLKHVRSFDWITHGLQCVWRGE